MIRERAGRLFYRLSYAHGKPNWDTGVAPNVLVELVRDLPPGRFLDLGCGTGASSVRLAGLGWEVVGVDFVPGAIAKARRRAEQAGVVAELRVGDVTRLDALVDGRRFDLILDVGCYHGLSSSGRERYAQAVARAAAPGAVFLLFGFRAIPSSWRLIGASGVGVADVVTRFAPWFTVGELTLPADGAREMAWYRLERRPLEPGPPPPGAV